ncbi:hypothetical protein [Silanimonas sp.]|uniref:hypothetical protein n=1 Tax=Silanimonas sp. TaxID=1929290 RepID=UPI0022BC586D|nr:hypothetical protein [Silanimonas sp.]MCZ8164472.1 hypothetical protein [Silanimonas sp.]
MTSSFGRTRAQVWPGSTARIATVVILVGYPVGALVRLLHPDTVLDVLGLAMIAIAGLVAAAFTATYAYQLVNRKEDQLDERERYVRYRAHTVAYTGIAAILLLGTIYLQLAFDFGWWMPENRGHWEAIFWGVLIAVLTLPATCLVWSDRSSESEIE